MTFFLNSLQNNSAVERENELVFSNGWLYKFKQHNNICRYHIYEESESASLASLPEERTKLQQLLS
ncbi:hypothetical protein RhiirA4_489595 [Rhizophagus irregularis]|uniref:HTH CENPB-type domain-containing protein n=1 Tax=Rhizophagus irregularis TaxID=588596 RepID=A0A2I1HUZ4_9GLOM|nr:hypothetical protein RhiirA4_489595 [Rhizophagus irregularis]